MSFVSRKKSYDLVTIVGGGGLLFLDHRVGLYISVCACMLCSDSLSATARPWPRTNALWRRDAIRLALWSTLSAGIHCRRTAKRRVPTTWPLVARLTVLRRFVGRPLLRHKFPLSPANWLGPHFRFSSAGPLIYDYSVCGRNDASGIAC